MADYQLTATDEQVIRTADSATIPNAPGNRDWDEYQAWLAAGNTPDPPNATVSPALDSIGTGPTTLQILGIT